MKIELTNTKDDLASFYQFDRWYSDERKNYRIKARLIGGTIATIPLLLIVINSDNAKVNSVSGLVIFGLLFFSLGFLGAKHSILSSLKGLANRVANDKANHEFLEPMTSDNTTVKIPTDTSSLPTTTLTADSIDMKYDNALTFINGYVDNCNKMNKAIDMLDWVNSNNLTTNDFKSDLKRILDEANEKEPGVGLDFDPILDAQDFPDKGFELESADQTTNYLVLRGKDWHDFKLTIKVVEENGVWLVDGCGIINIPTDKIGER